MIVVDGFGLAPDRKTLKCLRCGNMKLPLRAATRGDPRASDLDSARRFRDKAEEAQQLIDLAHTRSRRETLIQISNNYLRTAEQLESLAKSRK